MKTLWHQSTRRPSLNARIVPAEEEEEIDTFADVVDMLLFVIRLYKQKNEQKNEGIDYGDGLGAIELATENWADTRFERFWNKKVWIYPITLLSGWNTMVGIKVLGCRWRRRCGGWGGGRWRGRPSTPPPPSALSWVRLWIIKINRTGNRTSDLRANAPVAASSCFFLSRKLQNMRMMLKIGQFWWWWADDDA